MYSSSYLATVQALAAFIAKLQPTKGGKVGLRPIIPVKLYNMKTGKVGGTVENMVVDTGAEYTNLGGQYAKMLGIDDVKKNARASGTAVAANTQWNNYLHDIKIQIGSLTPITIPAWIADKTVDVQNLGWHGLLVKATLEIFGGITNPQLRYAELAQAAMANAHGYWRSRV